MHISIENISVMMTNRENITIDIIGRTDKRTMKSAQDAVDDDNEDCCWLFGFIYKNFDYLALLTSILIIY